MPVPEVPALVPTIVPVSAQAESSTSSAQQQPATVPLQQAPLMPFDATGRTAWAVPFGWQDYAKLVDWTGRQLRPNKKGCIPQNTPELLTRLGIDSEAFIAMASTFLQEFGSAVGAPEQMAQLCERRQTKFLHGMRAARKVFKATEAKQG